MIQLKFFLFSFILFATNVWARAGGGGGGGGGGRSGSGRYGIGSFIYAGLFVLINGIIFPAAIIYLSKRKNKKIKAALAEMALREKAWDANGLTLTARNLFLQSQKAWSKQNFEELQKILHSELYMDWAFQIQTQIARKQKNIMRDIEILYVSLVHVANYRDDEKDHFTVLIHARADDILYEEDLVIEYKPGKFFEFWTFTWEKDDWKVSNVSLAMLGLRFIPKRIIDESFIPIAN